MRLNGLGDLALEATIRPYIGTIVEVVKQTRGLYHIQTQDGKRFYVPKRNLDATNEEPKQESLPEQPQGRDQSRKAPETSSSDSLLSAPKREERKVMPTTKATDPFQPKLTGGKSTSKGPTDPNYAGIERKAKPKESGYPIKMSKKR